SDKAHWLVQMWFVRPLLTSSTAFSVVTLLAGTHPDYKGLLFGPDLSAAVCERVLLRLRRFAFTSEGKGRAIHHICAETA
ncbi:hypothetical protein SARC_14002, partial [Sphaeroforma arctica JP610]